MIKLTERGWAGHCVVGNRCSFKRNTLIEKDDIGIIVSTIGNYIGPSGKIETVGHNRYYETMVFKALKLDPYIDIDPSSEVPFSSKWCINANSPEELPNEVDNIANEMHDDVVREICEMIESETL